MRIGKIDEVCLDGGGVAVISLTDHRWLRPGNAGPKGELKDDGLKFGEVVLWVQAPPGQRLASRPVARLAVTPVMG